MAAAGQVLACRCSQTPPQSYAFSLESLHFSPVFRGKRVGEMYSWFVNEGKNVSCGRERDRYLLVLLLILNSR